MGGPGSGKKVQRSAAERDALLLVELPGGTIESATAAANSIVDAVKHGLHPKDADALTKAVSVVMRGAAVNKYAATVREFDRQIADMKAVQRAALAHEVADRQHLAGEEDPIEEHDPGDAPPAPKH